MQLLILCRAVKLLRCQETDGLKFNVVFQFPNSASPWSFVSRPKNQHGRALRKTLQYFQPSSPEMRERTHLILKLFENTETNTWRPKIQCSENGGVRFCTVGCSVCTLLLCQAEIRKKKVYYLLPGRVYCIYLNGSERGFRGTRSSIYGQHCSSWRFISICSLWEVRIVFCILKHTCRRCQTPP